MSDVPEWVTLTEGEEVIWQGRPTLYSYLDSMIFPVLLVLVGGLVWMLSNGSIDPGLALPSGIPFGLIGIGIVVLGVYNIVHSLLKWWSIRYLITSQELYRKHGVFSRHVENIRVDRIHNTSFSQSLVGRLLGHGDVHVDTAGGGLPELSFKSVPDPELVVSYITEEVESQRG